jgi:hypothetical protein
MKTVLNVRVECDGHTTQARSDTEKLQRRNRELSILNIIAQAMNQEVDMTRAVAALTHGRVI